MNPSNKPDPKAGVPEQTAAPDGNELPAAPADPSLSTEEQMERYEAYLKETDWGHRPC
ncbi:MAG TPA: hypothetical protein VEH04_20815 [Verrucomicrobiae bacterium]|nr:hypothetical protein [Verrucomicrobiae bacterium]